MQTWFRRLPAAIRALVTGVLSAVAIFAVMWLFTVSAAWDDPHESVTARLVVSTIAGLVTGVASVALGDRRMRRTYGSTERALLYSRALRTGELPREIEPATWQGWLAASSQSNRFAPSAVGVFAILGVLQAIDHEWWLVALFASFAIWQGAVALMARRRIARLTAAVGQHVAAQEERLGHPCLPSNG
ncbi:hypothetical protein [Mycolicibacterium sp.]|uniref:hypothetical protein n=1 Tax=Mycolicibacterium sp. TaxID=2320850 RepID=UPI001A2D1512|nr:hypothetical protein [Mycolicibacterium sp.]MBJ7339587.1 hypothetical protein [Mycolicibacterium sp.]